MWRVLALALVVAAIPLPALAGGPGQPAARPGIRASAANVVASTPLAHSASQATQATPDAKAQLDSGSFFKTPAGLAIIAVVAAGAGYAIYSTRHDRINSPGK
jgi:hypothetical protein